MKRNLYVFSLFFLAIGVIASVGKCVAVAGIILALDIILNKRRDDIKGLFTEKIFKNSVFYLFVFVGTLLLSQVLLHDKHGIKAAFNFLERSLPFFIFLIAAYKREYVLEATLLGVCVAAVIVDFDTFKLLKYQSNVRAVSHFIDKPNSLGGWAAMVIPIVLGLAFSLRQYGKIIIFPILVVVPTFGTLIASGSRGAILGLLCSTLLVGAVLTVRCGKRCVLALLVCAGIVAGGFHLSDIQLKRSYDQERPLLWKSSIEMVQDRPFLGVGWSNFNESYNKEGYISPLAKEPHLDTPHNFILHFLTQAGLVGTSGLVVMLVAQLLMVMKRVYVNKRINAVLIGMLVLFFSMSAHGMVDIINLNRFFVMGYALYWGCVCYVLFKECQEV